MAYDINPEARYRALNGAGSEERLVRYELPTVKQGWLDLDSGEEFEDI